MILTGWEGPRSKSYWWRRMKLLLDTHLLLWAAGEPDRLPAPARARIKTPVNELIFSAASSSSNGRLLSFLGEKALKSKGEVV
jgi:hypothetical protein